MALTESQNADRPARPLAGLIAHIRAGLNAWLNDTSDRSVTQRVASAAFLIRVCSAALIYLSQIVLARWMGRTEFGIYVYVWTWVTLIGDMADLGLATAAQRFIPDITAGDKRILLVDGSKFGRVALHEFAPLDTFDTVIVDAGLSAQTVSGLRDAGIRIETASSRKSGS